MNWKEQVAVVTGAADGIGQGIAISLAKRGCRVACLDIADEKNKETADKASRAAGVNCRAYHCDLADPVNIDTTFEAIFRDFGKFDILINNASVFSTMSFVEDSYESALKDYHFNMDINARGMFLCAKKVAPHMAEKGYGHIINVITNHVKRYLFPPSDNEHSYDASKYAQLALNESLDCELKKHGVRVNAICPAATRTPMLQAFFDDLGMELNRETIGKCAGIASLLEVKEVAEAVCYILDWDNTQPTGKAFLVMYSEDCEKLKYGYIEELAK